MTHALQMRIMYICLLADKAVVMHDWQRGTSVHVFVCSMSRQQQNIWCVAYFVDQLADALQDLLLPLLQLFPCQGAWACACLPSAKT